MFPQETFIKTGLGLSGKSESAPQLAQMYSFSFISDGQEVDKAERNTTAHFTE